MARKPRREIRKTTSEENIEEPNMETTEEIEESSETTEDTIDESVETTSEEVVEEVIAEPIVNKKEGTTAMKSFFESQYKVKAKPGNPISEAEGAKLQYAFYNEMVSVLNKVPEEAFKGLDEIAQIFAEEHDGILADRYVFRWMNSWQGGERREKAFLGLVNFFKALAEQKTIAKVRKVVNLDELIAILPTEQAKDNFTNWISKKR